MALKKTAIVIETHTTSKEMYERALRRNGFEVVTFDQRSDALNHLKTHSAPNIAIVHFSEDPKRSLRFISKLRSKYPTVAIIYITGYKTSHPVHLRAMNSGAYESLCTEDVELSKREFGDLVDRASKWSSQQKQTSSREVFVVMPFAKTFDDIYESAIKRPLEKLALTCHRGDAIPITAPKTITEEVFRRIQNAWLIVADLSPDGSKPYNPNVYFEVGYAFGRGKRIILLTASAAKIPFDVRWYQHIVYGGSIQVLRDALRKSVTRLMQDPDCGLEDVVSNFVP